MKVLFVCPSLPLNNGAGHAIRSYHAYTELRSFADVDVLTSNTVGISYPLARNFRKSHSYIGHINVDWKEYFFGFQRKLNRDLRTIIEKGSYDYVFIRYYNTAFRLGALRLDNLVLDCDDCYLELLVQHNSELSLNPIASLKTRISFKFRSYNYFKNLQRVKSVIFSKRSSQIRWLESFQLVPNKISYSAEKFQAMKSDSINAVTILFVGVLNYGPNYEGLYIFVEDVWPLVKKCCPQAKLKIVGAGLPEKFFVKWKRDTRIEICGYIDDINSVYEDIDIAIAPVYKGSGTHIKVMESLMRSKTMVISPLAHRGYEQTLPDKKVLFVAPTVDLYAEYLITLINDENLRLAMGAAGRKAVIAQHALETSPKYFKETFRSLAATASKQHTHSTQAATYGEAYE